MKLLFVALVVCAIAVRAQEELIKYPEGFEFREYSCEFQGPFAYIASIRDNTPQKDHICGGIVIAKDAVLTAAHCVDPRASKRATRTPTIHIGGENSDQPIEIRTTVIAIAHPEWNVLAQEGNDLVILKLNETTCVNPVTALGAEGVEGRDGLPFLGYGRTQIGGGFPYTLQLGQFSVLTREECNKTYEIESILERELCVRSQTTVGVCTGDEGGPLIYQPTLIHYKDALLGIASYPTNDCTETQGVAIFMDIYYYRDFINSTLNSERFINAGK